MKYTLQFAFPCFILGSLPDYALMTNSINNINTLYYKESQTENNKRLFAQEINKIKKMIKKAQEKDALLKKQHLLMDGEEKRINKQDEIIKKQDQTIANNDLAINILTNSINTLKNILDRSRSI